GAATAARLAARRAHISQRVGSFAARSSGFVPITSLSICSVSSNSAVTGLAHRFHFRTPILGSAEFSVNPPGIWVAASERPMPMSRSQTRVRSDAELAFVVMRTLAAARLLWAHGAALPVDDLAPLVDAPPDEIVRAVDGLCAEGIAE